MTRTPLLALGLCLRLCGPAVASPPDAGASCRQNGEWLYCRADDRAGETCALTESACVGDAGVDAASCTLWPRWCVVLDAGENAFGPCAEGNRARERCEGGDHE